MKKVAIIYLAIVVLAIVGETKCIIKAFSCNWEPIGKAEILYTGSAITGIGCITGWIDIQDK
jgi:hypothetical protein